MKQILPSLVLPAILLSSVTVHSREFFISDKPVTDPSWHLCCPGGVCVNRNWFQAPEIDYRYHFGYSVFPGEPTENGCLTSPKPNRVVESADFVRKLSDDVKNSDGRIVIFVHGYNVEFPEGLSTLRDIASSLDFPRRRATPLLFNWNSSGAMSYYTSDEEYSRVGGIGFSYTLRAIAAMSEVSEIHIIAHSMGNRVAVDGLERVSWMLQSELPVGKEWALRKFRSIAYFASDLSTEEHMVKTVRIHSTFTQLKGAVFFSNRDAALKVSKHVHFGVQRAGQTSSGLTHCVFGKGNEVLKKITVPSIDASSLSPNLRDFLGHSYITRSPVIRNHLSHLIFRSTFRPELHYRKVVRTGNVTKIGKSLGCESEEWLLPGN